MKYDFEKKIACLLLVSGMIFACQSQTGANNSQGENSKTQKLVGGPCDGCEMMFDGMPKKLDAIDTTIGWFTRAPKLVVSGQIFKKDGKTPAKDVVIYYYHTNENGYYAAKKETSKALSRHGDLRGWVKTDAEGKFTIYTLRPASYPGESFPAHIHKFILEPGISNPYYVDDWEFDDDPRLTQEKRRMASNRAGSGILKPTLVNGVYHAVGNHILGLNIPDYPE